jgi:hypothetical protein
MDIECKISPIIVKRKNHTPFIKKTENIDKLYSYLSKILTNDTITKDNIIYLVINLMQVVDTYKIKGQEKKELTISVLKLFIQNNIGDLSDDFNSDTNKNRNLLISYIENFLPSIIDILISMETNMFSIKKDKGCFS